MQMSTYQAVQIKGPGEQMTKELARTSMAIHRRRGVI